MRDEPKNEQPSRTESDKKTAPKGKRPIRITNIKADAMQTGVSATPTRSSAPQK
jgi:hypothetical protein